MKQDLTIEYKMTDEVSSWLKINAIDTHPKFKVNQVIEFNGGYNNDIRFRGQITGFTKDGEIYILWDAYWFSIKDDNFRNIKAI